MSRDLETKMLQRRYDKNSMNQKKAKLHHALLNRVI